MHTFFDTDSDAIDVLEEIAEKYSGRKLYVAYVPSWRLHVLASEPISPEKVQSWWNENINPESEDYQHQIPTIERL